MSATSGPSAIDLLTSRASASRLTEPGPSGPQIEIILKAAVTAADHGRIRPWRFVVMRGAGRARLAELMSSAVRAANPMVSDEELEKVRAKPMRAPVIIVVVAKTDVTHKVPVVEQLLAAGAAGAHLMLAANALGYGASWKTGAPSYHPLVRKGLGFAEDDAIIGFFYIGTDPMAGQAPPRASIESVVEYWGE